jgi:hypothetical protein
MKLFEFVDAPTIIKSRNPIEQQRYQDGSPHTTPGISALRAPGKQIHLDSLKKSASLAVEKKDLDPDKIVKSFLRS